MVKAGRLALGRAPAALIDSVAVAITHAGDDLHDLNREH